MFERLQVSVRHKLGILTFALYGVLLSAAVAAGSSVAVFPFQQLGEGRNDANLPFTRILSKRLTERGNEIIGLKAVIAYMAANRLRTVGHLQTYNILRVRSDLGASFVLLGTVTQLNERPEPSLGLTLQLVRTSDARTVWTYIGSVSTGEERRILGVGEPHSTNALQLLLLDDILEHWPWKMIKQEQSAGAIDIVSSVLWPRFVKPGEEVHSQVRLRNIWQAGQSPRAFFKVDEQLYPATVSDDGSTYNGTWVAGEKDGSSAVNLLLSWPRYGRSETALLGRYVIDGAPPLFELNFGGVTVINGIPVFNTELVIMPRMLVRKAMSRWHLSFYSDNGTLIGELDGNGNLPDSFVWQAKEKSLSIENGIYEVKLEAWDKAGNPGSASRRVELNRNMPDLGLKAALNGDELVVSLKRQGSVPLAFWRMQMWTEEGNLLTQSEGKDLPVKIQVKLPDSGPGQKVEGSLFVQDIMGNQTRRKVKDLLPKIGGKDEEKKEKPKSVSESWVDEF